MSTEKRERISPRLILAKNADGKFCTWSNSFARASETMPDAVRASQSSYQIATIEVKTPATASTIRMR